MNEKALEDVINDNISEVENDEVANKDESIEVEYTPLEQEAMKDGWTRKEDWTEAGKDPERWKSPHEFVEYGKLKAALDSTKRAQDEMKSDFDGRIKSLNKKHEADTLIKIQELKEQQRAAVEQADTDAYDKAGKELENLEKPKAEDAPPEKDPVIAEWEKKHEWINDTTDSRAMAANGIWNSYIQANPNSTNQQALAYLDKELDKLGIVKPLSNSRRDSPSENERTTIVPKKSGKVTMSTITAEEKEQWKQYPQFFGNDEKVFLKAIEDSRK